MFKKFSAIVATLSVVFTALTATAASATTYTPNSNSNVTGSIWEGTIPSNGRVQVSANSKRLSFSKNWRWEGTSLPELQDHVVSFAWTLTTPDNTVINQTNAMAMGYSAYAMGSLSGNTYKSINTVGSSTDLNFVGDAGVTYNSGSASFDIYSYDSTILQTGIFTLSLTLKVDGVEYTNFTTSGANNAYLYRNYFWVTGQTNAGTSLNVDYAGNEKMTATNTACIDTALVNVDDVLSIRRVVDGNAVKEQPSGVNRSISGSLVLPGSNGWVNLSYADEYHRTLTVTQEHKDRGVMIESDLQFVDSSSSSASLNADNGLSAGLHDIGISIVNQDGVEVTAGCTPPVPSTPTATIVGTSASLVSTGTFLDSSYVTYQCQLYKTSDNSALGSPTTAYGTNWVNGGYSSMGCTNIYGVPGGTQFYGKLVAVSRIYSGWTSTSAASASLTMPSPGVTITSTPSNGTAFGNLKSIVSHNQNVLAGSGTLSGTGFAEPTGGAIEVLKNMSNVSLRRFTTAGLDSTFGTKTIPTPYVSFNLTTGFHGTVAAPKPYVLFSSQSGSTALTIKDFNLDGSAGSTREVTNAQLLSLCQSEFGNTYTSVIAGYGVSSPTTEVYFQVACSAAPKVGYLLAKVNPAGAAAPTVVTNFGVPTADLTGSVTNGSILGMNGIPTSVNWTATGSTPMLTFIAMPLKIGDCNPSCASVYNGTAKIHRITAAGTALAPATAGVANPASGENLSISMSSVNFGDLLVTRRIFGMSVSTSFVKVGATGNGSALTPVWDSSVGQSDASSSLGTIMGKTDDGQVVLLRSASSAGANTVKLAKLNLANGAVTTFGEALSFTTSGSPYSFYAQTGNNGFIYLAQSALNSGKVDQIVSVGQTANPPVAPTVPVPAGDANTDLGRSLDAGGLKVTIGGTALNVVTGVKFGTVTAKFTKTATSLVITVPAGATGTSAVTVLYAGGTIAVGDWEYMGATKRAQTLTPTGLGAATFTGASDANRNLSVASSIDGYTVTITSKTPAVCTFVQGVIDFVGNGTCVIQATQAGDAVTAAATSTYEIYYETTVTASALYSTDAAKPTITLTGVGLGAVSKVMFGSVEVVPTKKTDTSITVKVPSAPSAGANVDVKLKYNNGTIIDTDLDFDFVGALKVEQELTFSAGFTLADYGDAVRTLSTISKDKSPDQNVLPDLPYVYSTSTPDVCDVDGDQLRFVAGGTCTVKVTQPGNVGVVAATASFNIIVSKKAQTITVNNTLSVTNVTGASLDADNSNDEVVLDYESSDESICTVDGDGFVTGIAAGSCEITITAEGDDRYLEDVKIVTVTVTDDPTDPAPEAADVIDQTPIAISNGGANAFISLSDPSLQVSWDKANGKLTPRATGVYTGNVVATLKFTVGGVDKFCTTVFGSTTALKVPAKPVLPENATAKQALAYAKAFAAYKKAYNAAFGSKIFKSAVFCADGNKLTGTTFGTLKKVAKTAAEKKVEAANLKLLKNYTGTVEISVKRWRAWPTTAKNKTGNGNVGKTIPATKNINTLTLG